MRLRYLYFLLFLYSCSDHASNDSFSKFDKYSFVDTSYKFKDTNDNKILLRILKGSDSSDYLNFKYVRKINNDWNLINEFDRIHIPFGLEFDHQDFSNDHIFDFVLLADRGGRGSNYFQHLLLFDTTQKQFFFIKNFDNICAPAFDSANNQIVGTGLSGAYQDVRYYKIQKDTIVQDSGVVYENWKMIKRYKLVNGKEVNENGYIDTTQ